MSPSHACSGLPGNGDPCPAKLACRAPGFAHHMHCERASSRRGLAKAQGSDEAGSGRLVARSLPREAAQVACKGGWPEAEQGSPITGARLDPGQAGASQKPRRATRWRAAGSTHRVPLNRPEADLSLSFPSCTQVKLEPRYPSQLILPKRTYVLPPIWYLGWRAGPRDWVWTWVPGMSTAFLTLGRLPLSIDKIQTGTTRHRQHRMPPPQFPRQ